MDDQYDDADHKLVGVRQQDGTVRFEHALKRKKHRRGSKQFGWKETPERDQELDELEDKAYLRET